jgi:hypothetical protein
VKLFSLILLKDLRNLESGIQTKAMNSEEKGYAVTLSPPSDISEKSFSDVCEKFEGCGWKFMGSRELAGKWHAHFGVLAPYATTSSFGKKLRQLLKAYDPEEYKNTVSVKVKAWYVGGEGFEPKVEHPGAGKFTTWEHYIEKDATAVRSKNMWIPDG